MLLGVGVIYLFASSSFAQSFTGMVEESGEVNVNSVPIASISGPTTVNAGQQYVWTVSTSSSSGPHTFYWDPGDGTGTQRFDGTGQAASRGFSHSYRGYNYVRSYTQRARTADRINISEWRTRGVTVRAF